MSTLDDVLTDVRRITDACDLPLLVDADTGWGGAFNIARTVKSFIKVGAAGMHIEDQVQAKRCGHRPGQGDGAASRKWSIASRPRWMRAPMRSSSSWRAPMRWRSRASSARIERAVACVEAGADMIFPEAMTELRMYRRFKDAVKVPVLANITEFGQTPLFTRDELGAVGVRHRAVSAARPIAR